jgi:hypothetical protein
MVWLILERRDLEARQKFRFRPSSFLDPVGCKLEEQKLWNAKLDGCWKEGEIGFLMALLKLV